MPVNFFSSYDTGSQTLALIFSTPIHDDIVTVVLDFTIHGLLGDELDGEILTPASPQLPSGDGYRGGQAVFRFHVLQGDANRDGVVNDADGTIIQQALGTSVSSPGFNPAGDLNGDGKINILDVATFALAAGRSLQFTDGSAPAIVQIAPSPSSGLEADIEIVTLLLNEPLDPLHFDIRTLFLRDASGMIHLPTTANLAIDGLSASYDFAPALPQCGAYELNVSNALADASGELLHSSTTRATLAGAVPEPPMLDAYTNASNQFSVTITGNAGSASTVEVSGPAGQFEVPVTAGVFSANVFLRTNYKNNIFFRAQSAGCTIPSAPAVAVVTHDIQAPNLLLDFPQDGVEVTTATVDFGGRVGDMLSGFQGLTVLVNNNPAIPVEIDIGIGNNGTFVAPNIPLVLGSNVLTAVATDAIGNVSPVKQITVTRADIPPDAFSMVSLSGSGQAAPIYSVLPNPIVVRVSKPDGFPFANKFVTFKVTKSDGRLVGDPLLNCVGGGTMMLQCQTDANGEARAFWRLGGDAGCGNNRVEVTSKDIAGTVAYCASASPGAPKQINIGSGNNQRIEVGSVAPEPLRAWVSDGCNGAENPDQSPVEVTFTVLQGGGKVNGQLSTTLLTGDTGHAEVTFAAGPGAGINVVEATYPNNPGHGARFVITGIKRDPLNSTSLSGLVLDNSSQPIQGATCTYFAGTLLGPVFSDINGQFRFEDIADSDTGNGYLRVDGQTASHVGGPGGQDVMPGSFPTLTYEIVTIPNTENTLPTPVLLPPLDPANTKAYDPNSNEDLLLTVAGIEGLQMRVKAHSVTFPVNYTGPSQLSLNQVHHDNVPMPMPDGAAPLFAWTLQPGGTRFNPPIEITYPNMSGLPAGAVAYFLTFNHDTGRFEIVASGHVTDDGSSIMSDPGAGISTAGWGCNCPPYSVTGNALGGCPLSAVGGTEPSCGCCTNADPCIECTPSGPMPRRISFVEDSDQLYGFDDWTGKEQSPPISYKSLKAFHSDTLWLTTPPSLASTFSLASTDPSIVVSPTQLAQSPQLLTLTASAPATSDIQVHGESSVLAAPCTTLSAKAYFPAPKTLGLVLVHEKNTDLPGTTPFGGDAGPFGSCIVPASGHCLETYLLGGDDQFGAFIGGIPFEINAGSNGICETVLPAITYYSHDIPDQQVALAFLNTVYSQAVVSWSIVRYPDVTVDFDLNCDRYISMLPFNGLPYTSEQQRIINEVGAPGGQLPVGLDKMIMLVDRPLPSPFSGDPAFGEMTVGDDFGFVYVGVYFPSTNLFYVQPNVYLTLAHELGHGLGLHHSNELLGGFDTADTNNLMHSKVDDFGGTKLRKNQWDILHLNP